MDKFKKLFNEAKELEQQFSTLKTVVQNPDSLCRDRLETFLDQIQQFESSYEAWKFKTIDTVEKKVYPTIK